MHFLCQTALIRPICMLYICMLTDKKLFCTLSWSARQPSTISFNDLNLAGVADYRISCWIFNTEHMACKVIITVFGYFLNLKRNARFFLCLTAAMKGEIQKGIHSVLECISINSPNFLIEISSHVTFEYFL